MDMKNYQYRSDFAQRYVAQGREEERDEGRVEMLRKLLTLEFGPLPPELEQRPITSAADAEVLLERALKASTLDELFAIDASD